MRPYFTRKCLGADAFGASCEMAKEMFAEDMKARMEEVEVLEEEEEEVGF